MKADLALWNKVLELHNPGIGADVQQTLQHWQRDPDLAGVREPDQLAALGETERDAWRALWAEAAQTLSRARAMIPAKEESKE